MDIISFWLLLSAVVASAARSRGRARFAWLLLSIVISPLIAGLLVLALPRLNRMPANGMPAPDEPAEGMTACDRPVTERPGLSSPGPESRKKTGIFEPDGTFAGIPYKVSEAGAVEVLLSGGRVRFRNMEQFLALATKDPNLGKVPS